MSSRAEAQSFDLVAVDYDRLGARVGKNVLDGIIMSDSEAFRADLARSIRLFRAFRTEQEEPENYYTALARDTSFSLAATPSLTAGS